MLGLLAGGFGGVSLWDILGCSEFCKHRYGLNLVSLVFYFYSLSKTLLKIAPRTAGYNGIIYIFFILILILIRDSIKKNRCEDCPPFQTGS